MKKILTLFVFLLVNNVFSSGGFSPAAIRDGFSPFIVYSERLISARFPCRLTQGTVNLYFLSSDSSLLSKTQFVTSCIRTFVIDNSDQGLKFKQEHFFKKFRELKGSSTHAILTGEDMYSDLGCDAETIANNVINYVNPTGGDRPITVSQEDRHLARMVIGELGNRCSLLNGWRNIEGSLKQISVGFNAVTCGVNSADMIFCRLSVNSPWFNIPGGLRQVSVSKTDDTICGVNVNDEIFCKRGFNSSPNWVRVNGSLKWISVYAEGEYWGVNREDRIFRSSKLLDVHPVWISIDGLLKQVSVGFNRQVCGVNASDQIFCRLSSDGSWIHLPGSLKEVSVSVYDNSVCGVNASNQVFCRHSILNNDWYFISGNLKSVDSFGYGMVWAVNNNDQIFVR